MRPGKVLEWLFSETPLAFSTRVLLIVGVLTSITLTPLFKVLVEQPLILFISWVTEGFLSLLGAGTWRAGSFISSREFSIEIVSGCTGIFTFILLFSAIVSFPVSWRSRLRAILAGALLIGLLNEVRIISLFYIGRSFPEAFDDIHIYVWQGVIIVAVAFYFYAWVARSLSAGRAAST